MDGEQVGVIRPDVLKQLLRYPEVFGIRDKENTKVVELNPAFRDYNEKSENVDRVLRQFRNDGVFVTLKGWRDEVGYSILFYGKTLFFITRRSFVKSYLLMLSQYMFSSATK